MQSTRRRFGSVRARTTVLAALVVAVALAAGAAILLVTLHSSLVRSGDTAAVARAQDLAALAEAGALPETVSAPAEDDIVQVVNSEGRVVAASANALGRDPITAFEPTGSAATVRTVRDVADGAERESYRVWALRGRTGQRPFTVYVGISLEQVSEATTRLRAALGVGLPVMVALLAFSTWVLLGRALRPVEAIRSQVADISEKALDRRVPVPRSDDEISRLARTMNAMLDRLESASRRQREFVADASHELQTPLASFRAQLEVSLAHPGTTDWPATAAELLGDSDRMERIVADLLYLARTDAVPTEPPTSLVDLDEIVLDEVNRVRSHTSVGIDTAHVSAAPVRGSGEDLRRMIRNVLENGVRHARSALRVELTADADTVTLTVADDGPGVPAEHRERIFERFVRLDDSRRHDDGGTGLGLAIVRAIATRHGGHVALEPSDEGARVVVRLPMSHQGLGSPSGPVPADRGA